MNFKINDIVYSEKYGIGNIYHIYLCNANYYRCGVRFTILSIDLSANTIRHLTPLEKAMK